MELKSPPQVCYNAGSPKDSGAAITLELKRAREFFDALATRTAAPPSTGFDVSADAKPAIQGTQKSLHAANMLS